MKQSTIGQPGLKSKPTSDSSEAPRPSVADEFDRGHAIDAAIDEAGKEALLFHKRMGNPVAVWKDGKVVWIAPEDIPA